jgi:hypothetical protein
MDEKRRHDFMAVHSFVMGLPVRCTKT